MNILRQEVIQKNFLDWFRVFDSRFIIHDKSFGCGRMLNESSEQRDTHKQYLIGEVAVVNVGALFANSD